MNDAVVWYYTRKIICLHFANMQQEKLKFKK